MSLTKSGVADQTVGGGTWPAGPCMRVGRETPSETSPVWMLQATASWPTFSGVIWVRGENFCARRSPLKVGQSCAWAAAGEAEGEGEEGRRGSCAAAGGW